MWDLDVYRPSGLRHYPTLPTTQLGAQSHAGGMGPARPGAAPGFQGKYPRVSIWQGTTDTTVDPPNARELLEQWSNVHGIDQTPDEREDGSNYTHLRFKDSQGNVLIESYDIRGFGHATPIDPDGQSSPVEASATNGSSTATSARRTASPASGV